MLATQSAVVPLARLPETVSTLILYPPRAGRGTVTPLSTPRVVALCSFCGGPITMAHRRRVCDTSLPTALVAKNPRVEMWDFLRFCLRYDGLLSEPGTYTDYVFDREECVIGFGYAKRIIPVQLMIHYNHLMFRFRHGIYNVVQPLPPPCILVSDRVAAQFDAGQTTRINGLTRTQRMTLLQFPRVRVDVRRSPQYIPAYPGEKDAFHLGNLDVIRHLSFHGLPEDVFQQLKMILQWDRRPECISVTQSDDPDSDGELDFSAPGLDVRLMGDRVAARRAAAIASTAVPSTTTTTAAAATGAVDSTSVSATRKSLKKAKSVATS